ncbi:unnamed protein product [Lactuca virosa]|uniref:Uncharacterized protein n=1 Tax=Lactuca virosa TaxID=75947 RepID=A0AAU9P377_9ASTR|nr:unnamed protein product [Lactuca virosa]
MKKTVQFRPTPILSVTSFPRVLPRLGSLSHKQKTLSVSLSAASFRRVKNLCATTYHHRCTKRTAATSLGDSTGGDLVSLSQLLSFLASRSLFRKQCLLWIYPWKTYLYLSWSISSQGFL